MASLIIVCAYVFYQIIKISNESSGQSKIEIGQKWVYISKDPFYKIRDTVTVINVKDGYVQYTNGIDTSSSSIRLFLYNTKVGNE